MCQKPSTRSRTFENTVNPWNKNALGEPKSPDEVLADVRAEAAQWEPDFTHAKCKTDG